MEELIEFVKHFRSHLGPITEMVANYNGTLLCTVSADKSVKVFDVINFGKYYTIWYKINIISSNKTELQE